jgi:hypothetical protein
VIVAVDGFAVGRSASVRDPRSRAGAHHRLERGDEAAGGPLDVDAVGTANVDVRLAVGDDDDVVAVQFPLEHVAQRLLRPDHLIAVAGPVMRLEIAHQLANVARDRRQLGHDEAARRPQQPFAPDQRAQPRDPPAPRQLRDDDRDQRDDRRQRDEEHDHVALGFLAAALRERHVVDQREQRPRSGVFDRPDGDVQQPARRAQQRTRGINEIAQRSAVEFVGKIAGGERSLAVGRAHPHRVQALVAGQPTEELLEPQPVAGQQQFRHRLLHGVGNQVGTHVQVAREPAQDLGVDQRHRRVSGDRQRDQQRHEETQR